MTVCTQKKKNSRDGKYLWNQNLLKYFKDIKNEVVDICRTGHKLILTFLLKKKIELCDSNR